MKPSSKLIFLIITLLSISSAYAFPVGEYSCFEFDKLRQTYGRPIAPLKLTPEGIYIFNISFEFTGGNFVDFPTGDENRAYSLQLHDEVLNFQFKENNVIEEARYFSISALEVQIDVFKNNEEIDSFRCEREDLFLF